MNLRRGRARIRTRARTYTYARAYTHTHTYALLPKKYKEKTSSSLCSSWFVVLGGCARPHTPQHSKEAFENQTSVTYGQMIVDSNSKPKNNNASLQSNN